MKNNVERLLDTAGVTYIVHEYPVDDGLIDGMSIAAKIGKPAEQVFKTLVTEAPGHEYFVFIVPACNELDLKKAARACGRKSIAMIPSKQLLPLTGYIHGGCSPVGMKKRFPTFIDETAILFDTICVSGGKVGLNLEIDPEVLASTVDAQFVDLAIA